MKRYKLIIFIAVLLFTQHAIAAGPQGLSELRFSEGILCYQKENFRCAEKKFLQALKLDLRNPAALHYLGLIAYQREEYSKANNYFTQAIEASPRQDINPETYFNRALSREKASAPGATEDLKKVANWPTNIPVKTLANEQLQLNQNHKSPIAATSHRIGLNVTMGGYYDSNASLNPDNLTVASLPTDTNDFQLYTRGSVSYRIVPEGRYRLKARADYSQSFYKDLIQFNYGIAHGEILQEVNLNKSSFYLPLSYDYSLLNTHRYLQTPAFKPAFRYRLFPKWTLEVAERVKYDDFFQTITNPNQNRDSVNLQSEMGHYFSLGRGNRYLHLFYTYENNLAKGSDWDYDSHSIGVQFVTPLFWKISSSLGTTQMVARKFKNTDSILGLKRDDRYQSYNAALSRPLWEHTAVTATYQFIKNNSNTAIFEYNRHFTGVSFAYTFE